MAERSPRRHLLPLFAITVVTVTTLWPAVAHFRTRALVDRLDGAVFTWAWWAMPRAVLDGRNPFHTDQIFHPVGADLALTTTVPLVSVLTWPIQVALGPEAQVNTVQLAAGFSAGAGGYLLAHRVTARRLPALFAGIAFMLTTHRLVHVPGHLNLIHTWVLPFGCLAFLRFVDEPTRRRAAAVGALGGGSFLVDPQLSLLLLAALVGLAATHRAVLKDSLGRLGLGAALAVVVAAPLLVPMGLALRGEVNPARPLEEAVYYSASPLAWILPSEDHVVLGHVVGGRSPSPSYEGSVYPGVAVLVLGVASIALAAPDRRRGWGAVAVTGVLLSFGPRLVAYDRIVDLPMPYTALRAVPGLDIQRVPARFALVGALGLCILAACTLAQLSRRWGPRSGVVAGAVLLLTVVDLFPTGLPQPSPPIPEAFRVIADHPGEEAVLEIPVHWYTGDEVVGDRTDFSALVHATVHGRPIVSGGVSRLPDWRLEALMAVPVYRQVLALQGEDGFNDPARFDAEDLRLLGIGYVVYDRERPAPRALSYLSSLGLPILVDDGRVLVWNVPPVHR